MRRNQEMVAWVLAIIYFLMVLLLFCGHRWQSMNTLVIFSGLPGTGKSTLANRLARELQWTILRIDDVVNNILKTLAPNFGTRK